MKKLTPYRFIRLFPMIVLTIIFLPFVLVMALYRNETFEGYKEDVGNFFEEFLN